MIKTIITETTLKYDKDGNIVEKIIREEKTEDDETRYPGITTTYPYVCAGDSSGHNLTGFKTTVTTCENNSHERTILQ